MFLRVFCTVYICDYCFLGIGDVRCGILQIMIKQSNYFLFYIYIYDFIIRNQHKIYMSQTFRVYLYTLYKVIYVNLLWNNGGCVQLIINWWSIIYGYFLYNDIIFIYLKEYSITLIYYYYMYIIRVATIFLTQFS